METYFTIWYVPHKALLRLMLIKLATRHINELKHKYTINYFTVREQLLNVIALIKHHDRIAKQSSERSINRDESHTDDINMTRLLK